jgi:enoyl-CoA hydratase/carnithine racemase
MSIALPASLIAETSEGVARLILNRPEKHNVIDYEMWRGIASAMQAFSADDGVRVVVVSGAGGKAFSAGADISEFERKRQRDTADSYNQATAAAHSALGNCPKPTIAEIGGYCVGGGLGLALACDLRIAADHSRFGIPAARLGLGYDYSSLKVLVSIVGPAAAKDIMFTARRFGAAEAVALGLVNRVVVPAELAAAVADCARMIAANAPLTVRASKQIVTEVLKDSDQRDRALCERLVAECFASADYVEGRQAFMEKREPCFRGR